MVVPAADARVGLPGEGPEVGGFAALDVPHARRGAEGVSAPPLDAHDRLVAALSAGDDGTDVGEEERFDAAAAPEKGEVDGAHGLGVVPRDPVPDSFGEPHIGTYGPGRSEQAVAIGGLEGVGAAIAAVGAVYRGEKTVESAVVVVWVRFYGIVF